MCISRAQANWGGGGDTDLVDEWHDVDLTLEYNEENQEHEARCPCRVAGLIDGQWRSILCESN